MSIDTIVSCNYKGGTGKTTTARVLAQALALDKKFTKGKPILVIDLDPQGNTSRRWQLLLTDFNGSSYPIPHPDLSADGHEPNYSSVCDLWLPQIAAAGWEDAGDEPLESLIPLPYKTKNKMIEVVPAHEGLMSYALSVPMAERPLLGLALRQWLRSDEIKEAYSCVIIDTQPSKSSLIDAALAAATHVYVPFIPEPQSIEGVFSILSYIFLQQQIRGNDVPLTMLGLFPNMVTDTLLHRTHLDALKKDSSFSKYLMPVRFGRRIAYSETDDYRNTPDQVTDLANTRISEEARLFARYIIKRLNETREGQ